MTCPRCKTDNREGRRFCGECGAPLPSACPSCGFANEAAEKFCGGCGQPLAIPQRATPASTASPSPTPTAATAPSSSFASPDAYTPKHLAERILPSRSAVESERKQATV